MVLEDDTDIHMISTPNATLPATESSSLEMDIALVSALNLALYEQSWMEHLTDRDTGSMWSMVDATTEDLCK